MKPFYSILSVEPNSYSSENVVVGLIMVADKIYFNFSFSKLNLIKKFNKGDKMFFLAENSLKKISKLIHEKNYSGQYEAFNNTFSVEYFKYLSQYATGSLVFSEPKLLNVNIDEQTFKKYYQLFVGESLIVKNKSYQKTYKSKINSLFIEKNIESKVDLDYTLNPNTISGILKDTNVSLITVNGDVNCLQTLNLATTQNIVANNIYEAQILSEGLNEFGKEKGVDVAKMKLAIEIPQDSKQKSFFDKVYSEKKHLFDFYEYDQVVDFANTIAQSDVYSKFSKLIY